VVQATASKVLVVITQVQPTTEIFTMAEDSLIGNNRKADSSLTTPKLKSAWGPVRSE
jgi:hypothetical protein